MPYISFVMRPGFVFYPFISVLCVLLRIHGVYCGNESRVEISFSSAESPLDYQSSIVFDPRGMEHLYAISQMFLDFIVEEGVPKEILTDDIFTDPIEVFKKNRSPLMTYYMGPLVVAMCTLSLAVLIPFIGLIFCCCRCAAGRCGGRKGVPEKRRDACKRGLCSLFFFPFVVSLLFGLVCAFVTNEYIEQGIESLPESIQKSSGDINTFLVNTRSEVNTLLIDNFKQLQSKLETTLDRSGETVKTRLGEVSKAVAVDNLTVIVSRLEEIQQHLKSLVEYTVLIQQSTGQLQLGLRNLQRELIQTLRDCSNQYCRDELEQQNFSALDVITDTSKLPDLNPVVKNVSALLSNNIREEITKGKVEFDKLSNTIQKAVNRTVPDIKGKIAQVGEEMTRMAINISDSLYIPKLQETKKYVNEYKPIISMVSRYRWYACLICTIIMLMIVLCFSFGLSCGVCGNERNGNLYAGDTGCNRSKGACFLLCGVALLFLFSFCLLIVTTALFLVGTVAERGFCDSVSNSSSHQLQQFIHLLQKFDVPRPTEVAHQVDYLDILKRCSQNETLYKAFGFDKHTKIQIWPNQILEVGNFSEIKNYRERYQMDNKLQDFLHQISINPNVILLTPEGISLLERLRDTPISDINFDIYLSLGENGLTGVNLMDVSREITDKANLLPTSQSRTANHLKNLAIQLESYENKLVHSIMNTIKQLKTVVKKLKNEAEFNGKDLQKAIAQLLEQAKWAQSFISNKGREELRKLATEFVNEFTLLMDRYADHVQYQVEEVVGRCGPINRVYKASLISVCDEIIQPFNGYWVSLSFCVLVCLPSMIVAIVLSVLYRRVDPYPTPLGDTGHRKTGRTERGSYENRIGFIHDYSPGCGEMIPLSRSSRDYPMSPESPTYPLFAPLSTTPTAPDVLDWSHERPNPALLPEYSKPPPYNYPA